jgi:hypothetical protein
MSGDKTIGWIERTGCDHYWTIATFKPGSDFESFKEILEATVDEDDEDLIALERVNDLSLVVGDPPSPIRDFQMTSKTTVEFKEGAWA